MDLYDLNFALHNFSHELTEETFRNTRGNCITHARALLALFNRKIGSQRSLQDVSVQTGVVIDITPSNQVGIVKRRIHASNFLVGRVGNSVSTVEADAFYGKAHLKRARSPLSLVRNAKDDKEVIIYGQQSGPNKSWEADFADELRIPPFTIDPACVQMVVLGERLGDAALAELQASASPPQLYDRTKIPVLKLNV